jgi:pyridoxal 5'-phosphate synthase pdxT subunit
MNVGILSIQGSVVEHAKILKKLGVNFIFVKNNVALKDLTHLIIPGGESTTLTKLLKECGMWDQLKKRAKHKTLQIFGTCAGAILCEQFGLGAKVTRNAYGAQLNSFSADLESKKFPDLKGLFIRAPKFESVADSVTILAEYKGEPVLIQQNNILASAFHPELTKDTRIHEHFLNNEQTI